MQQRVASSVRQQRDAREFCILSKELIDVESEKWLAERERQWDREDEEERWEEREKAIREQYATSERILREKPERDAMHVRDRLQALGAEVQRLRGLVADPSVL